MQYGRNPYGFGLFGQSGSVHCDGEHSDMVFSHFLHFKSSTLVPLGGSFGITVSLNMSFYDKVSYSHTSTIRDRHPWFAV